MVMQRVRIICGIVALLGCAAWIARANATERLLGGSATLPRTRTVADDLVPRAAIS